MMREYEAREWSDEEMKTGKKKNNDKKAEAAEGLDLK